MGNKYIHYYLGQQQGRGMPVFRGRSWQRIRTREYGQTGYGLGALFSGLARAAIPMLKTGLKTGVKSLGRAAVPMLKRSAKSAARAAVPVIKRNAKAMIKSGAKSLARTALSSGSDMLSDVLGGRSVKESARARGREGINTAKMRARQRAQRYAQTRRGRSRTTKRRGKKRKASASATGDYKKNLSTLKPFPFSFIGITVNGEEVPFKPLQLSYTDATIRYIEAYLTMFSGTGKLFYDTGNGISRDDFKDGYALYAADLTPDMCGSSDHFNVVQRGNLALILKFTTAPTAAVSLVCYAEFENTIHIDSERNVIYNYGG